MKRLWIALILTIGLACLGLAQSYSPKSGETVLRLAVEGRGNVYILLHTKQAPRTTARITARIMARTTTARSTSWALADAVTARWSELNDRASRLEMTHLSAEQPRYQRS